MAWKQQQKGVAQMAQETTYALWNDIVPGQKNGPEVTVVNGCIVSVRYWLHGALATEYKVGNDGVPTYTALGKVHRLIEQPRE